MTQAIGFDVGPLRSAMRGTVFGPDDAGFEDARSIWNGDIRKRPAVIARCVGPGDVGAALAFARGNALEVSVRGGGHSYSGSALSDGGLTVDLSALNQVVVDPETRTARVGGGAALANLDAATQAHGLAVPAGVISHTGVGGLTLGGGMGWLTRMHGLALDNLASAEVVLADGRIRPRLGRRAAGPVLGAARRRRQLRRGHRVRVPAARGRSDGAVRPVLLGRRRQGPRRYGCVARARRDDAAALRGADRGR